VHEQIDKRENSMKKLILLLILILAGILFAQENNPVNDNLKKRTSEEFAEHSVNRVIPAYQLLNCVIVNNQFYTGVPDKVRLNPVQFEIKENSIIKEGEKVDRC